MHKVRRAQSSVARQIPAKQVTPNRQHELADSLKTNLIWQCCPLYHDLHCSVRSSNDLVAAVEPAALVLFEKLPTNLRI